LNARRALSYPTYLELGTPLSLQSPKSRPEHPDELLFIVVHQSSELWLKVLLHEFDHLIARLEGTDVQGALTSLLRINALVEMVSHELSALGTLPPQRVARFRGYLGSSSGSQTAQLRAIEATSKLRDPHFMAALHERGELPPLVVRILERPTLQAPNLAPEHGFARWCILHVRQVERIIGPETGGTGGTLGARYPAKPLSQRFFPDPWAVRTRLYGRG